VGTGPRNRSFSEKTVRKPTWTCRIRTTESDFESFMEDMAKENGDFKFLPLCENIYVLLGIFHSIITKDRFPSGESICGEYI